MVIKKLKKGREIIRLFSTKGMIIFRLIGMGIMAAFGKKQVLLTI